LDTAESEAKFIIRSQKMTAEISRKTGALLSWKVDGRELLAGPLEPSFWKTRNDNQMRNQFDRRLGIWRHAARDRKVISVEAEHPTRKVNGNTPGTSGKEVAEPYVLVTAKMQLPVGETICMVQYKIFVGGLITVTETLTPYGENLPLIPRVGMDMTIPAKYDQIKYFGLSGETYPDRKTGGKIGVYKASAQTWNHEYSRPQDVGNRTDTLWICLTDANGNGLKIQAFDQNLLNISVWPFTPEDLEKAKHPTDLPVRDTLHVRIDHLIHGVGGDNSWGARTHDAYTIPADRKYGYKFMLMPIIAEQPLK
jgi:beta-galactosidase